MDPVCNLLMIGKKSREMISYFPIDQRRIFMS